MTLEKIEYYRSILKYCKVLEDRITKLEEKAATLESWDESEDIRRKIAELKDEYIGEYRELVSLHEEIKQAINRVKHPEYKAILELRIIDGMTLRQIAEIIHYEHSTVLQKYRNAVKMAI